MIGRGIYFQVPFGAHRCDYCVFATYANRDDMPKSFAMALHAAHSDA